MKVASDPTTPGAPRLGQQTGRVAAALLLGQPCHLEKVALRSLFTLWAACRPSLSRGTHAALLVQRPIPPETPEAPLSEREPQNSRKKV